MKKSAKIAFCSVTGASIILLMFLGNIIPIATYAVPCLASMLMMIAMEECGERYAWALFFAICALSFIIIADKELLLIFMLFLGYYPMLKKHIEKLRFPAVQAVLKLAAFNLAIAVVYMLLLLVFPISDLISRVSHHGHGDNYRFDRARQYYFYPIRLCAEQSMGSIPKKASPQAF